MGSKEAGSTPDRGRSRVGAETSLTRPWQVERDRHGIMFSGPLEVGEMREVVPVEVLAGMAFNEDGEAFMRAWRRAENHEPDPPGTRPCASCGMPLESDQSVFRVPTEFARFSRYVPPEGDVLMHISCAFTAYKGRFELLVRMLVKGASHEAMREALACWPWTPEEVAEAVDA